MSSISQSVEDYIKIDFEQLMINKEITFSLYIVFIMNNHVILFKKNGSILDESFFKKYGKKKLIHLWIHHSENEAFKKYLLPEEEENKEEAVSKNEPLKEPQEATLEPEPEIAEPSIPEPEEPPPPEIPEAAITIEVLNSEEVPEEEKKEVTSELAKSVLNKIMNEDQGENEKEQRKYAKQFVKEILENISSDMNHIIKEIWEMGETDPELEHAINTSTYGVIFALAFGKIEKETITNIATAGLLHDIGVVKMNLDLFEPSMKDSDLQTKNKITQHVTHTLEILKNSPIKIDSALETMILQHHEKFDGTGYPNQIQGFQLDDLAQLVNMANLMDEICSGYYDGTPKTIEETFSIIDEMEKDRSFPENFNPEIFSEVRRWTKNMANEEEIESAAIMVGKQAQDIINKDLEEKAS